MSAYSVSDMRGLGEREVEREESEWYAWIKREERGRWRERRVSDMRGLGERRGRWRERRVSDMRGLGEREVEREESEWYAWIKREERRRWRERRVSDMRGLRERRGRWREWRVSDMRGLRERRGRWRERRVSEVVVIEWAAVGGGWGYEGKRGVSELVSFICPFSRITDTF
jgi:hypothetical protein